MQLKKSYCIDVQLTTNCRTTCPDRLINSYMGGATVGEYYNSVSIVFMGLLGGSKQRSRARNIKSLHFFLQLSIDTIIRLQLLTVPEKHNYKIIPLAQCARGMILHIFCKKFQKVHTKVKVKTKGSMHNYSPSAIH